MSVRPALPFRLLQRSLKAASRAGTAVVERVLRSEVEASPLRSPTKECKGELLVQFGDKEVRVQPGATLLDAARQGDVDLRYYCGGNCSCGTCRVEILEGGRNLSRVESMEAFVLGDEHQRKGDRLACQATVRGPVRVHIPEWF